MLAGSLHRYTATERVEKLTKREKCWRKELFDALQPVEEPEPVHVPAFNRRQVGTMQQAFKKLHVAHWLGAKSIPEPAVQSPVDPRLRRLLRVYRGHSVATPGSGIMSTMGRSSLPIDKRGGAGQKSCTVGPSQGEDY